MKTTTLLHHLRTVSTVLDRIGASLQSPLLLVLRLYWGWSFFETGKGKLLNLGQTTEFFASLGLPLPAVNATLAGATECFGGLLLLVGLASRFVALPLIFTMLVAYFTADLDAVKNLLADPDKFLSAAPFLFLLVSLLIFVFGPGAFSLDHWLGKKSAARASITPLATQHA